MINILICDDENDIVAALEIYLKTEGYNIYKAYTGIEALDVISKNDIHLVLMDIMMPVMDGITALIELRERTNIPVILLTAKGEDMDKVLGLEMGADDYITKPFTLVEVIARVKSQLRRYMRLGGSENKRTKLVVGGIELDDGTKQVTVDGEEIQLTPIEFDLLKLFMSNPGIVFHPADIYKFVWNESPVGSENTIAVHIRHLRAKIEINPATPRYIKSVWGQGYKMEDCVLQ